MDGKTLDLLVLLGQAVYTEALGAWAKSEGASPV